MAPSEARREATRNVGGVDAWLRATASVGLFGVAGVFNERLGLVFGVMVVAVMLALTALAGWCPLYRLLGIDTCQEGQPPPN